MPDNRQECEVSSEPVVRWASSSTGPSREPGPSGHWGEHKAQPSNQRGSKPVGVRSRLSLTEQRAVSSPVSVTQDHATATLVHTVKFLSDWRVCFLCMTFSYSTFFSLGNFSKTDHTCPHFLRELYALFNLL